MTPTYPPLWDALVLALPPLYYYKGIPYLSCKWQVESLVFSSNQLLFPLLPVMETAYQATVVRPEDQYILFISIILDYMQRSLQSKDSLHRR
jgi:hypothetical protein